MVTFPISLKQRSRDLIRHDDSPLNRDECPINTSDGNRSTWLPNTTFLPYFSDVSFNMLVMQPPGLSSPDMALHGGHL